MRSFLRLRRRKPAARVQGHAQDLGPGWCSIVVKYLLPHFHFSVTGKELSRENLFIPRSPKRRRSRSRSGSRKRKHRKRSRSRSRDRKRKSSRSYSSERRAREREKERQKKGLPPIRSRVLSGKFTEVHLMLSELIRVVF